VSHTLSNSEGGSATTIEKTFDVEAFNGSSTEGDWELRAADLDAYNDSGAIEFWSIEFVH